MAEERARVERTKGRRFFVKLFRKADAPTDKQQMVVDVYQASVEECFIPQDFNEELPLYLLDLGGMVLVLFGQWMFDPHTLVAPKDVFEKWNCERAFFRNFSLRCLAEGGTVFELSVSGTEFVETHRLASPVRFRRLRECEFVVGHSATLSHDLEKAGLIDPA